jgi:hypothetical protein
MAGLTDTFENAFLDLLLRATAIANIADNAASSPQTDWYHSLHTADPTDSGTQTSSEIGYTGYARATVARSTGYNAASGGSASPAANIDFDPGTGGSGTATHFGIGKNLTTAGTLVCAGTVTPNIVTGDGVTPRLTTATTITLD